MTRSSPASLAVGHPRVRRFGTLNWRGMWSLFRREQIRFLRYAGHWSLMGFGYWAIEWRETGQFIGEVGFADFHRNINPPLQDMPEIGWALARSAHGQGLASEAVRAAITWGEAHFPPKTRTACLINPDNAGSLRIAEAFGYREAARTIYKDHPIVLLVR